jgi:hypothetical protein
VFAIAIHVLMGIVLLSVTFITSSYKGLEGPLIVFFWPYLVYKYSVDELNEAYAFLCMFLKVAC